MKTATRQAVWDKTGGHCAYCGCDLIPDGDTILGSGKSRSWMMCDHAVSKADGGVDAIDNLLPSCSPCNYSKNRRSIEDYRQYVSRKKAGWPVLTRDVADWLESVGFQFPDLPRHEFWFESSKAKQPEAAQ